MSDAEDVTPVDNAGPEKAKLVVVSQMKAFVKAKDLNVGGDLADGLSLKVEELLNAAVVRCLANGRKTLRSSDL